MTVLDGPPQIAAESAGGKSRMTCPECAADFVPVHPNQMFCCKSHRKAFLNRQTVRGAVLAPLAMAARISRGGTRTDEATGKRARKDSETLIGRWVVDDRQAGRMSMLDYIALCYRKGFERT